MKISLKIFCIAVLFFSCISFIDGQQLTINEIMASNGSTVADENGDFEDWIELYNAGNEVVDLTGFGLSDDLSRPFRWTFPNITINPGEFLLVWASGKDRKNSENPLHTNFSISSQGEPILITHPDGSRIDLVDAIPIPRDISYGRYPDGESELRFFAKATPGEANDSDTFIGILEELQFQTSRLGSDSFQVTLNHSDTNTIIFYALDGHDPLENGVIYEGPFNVQSKADNALMFIRTVPYVVDVSNYGWIRPPDDFEKGLTIRAVATKPGYKSSPVVGRTLFSNLPDFPVVSVSINNDDFFDDSIGIYVPGLIYQQNGFNWDNPWGYPNANYHQSGSEWERPISVEFIYPGGKYHARELGVRIHGSGSRALPQKSLRLYARPTNGGDQIEFDVFQNGEEGYNRLVVRTSGQDAVYNSTLFRDAVIHRIFSHMNMEDQKAQPVILYVNGEFWGLHNLRERFDMNYLERRFGLDPDLIDYLEFDGEVKEGNDEHYLILREHLTTADLSDEVQMDYLRTLMDVDNYINYNVAQIYSSNYDWPGNNIEYWRLRTNYVPNTGPGLDGRWRWVFKDIDSGFGVHNHPEGASYNMLAHALEENGPAWPNPPWSTRFLRAMLNNTNFKNKFINRFCDEMNTSLQPDRVEALINKYAISIAPFINDHSKRWGRPKDSDQWQENVNNMIDYARMRPHYQRQHLREYFDLGEDKTISLNISPEQAGVIKVNSVIIESSTPGLSSNPYPWQGIYFSDVDIQLEAIPAFGFVFSHWEGAVHSAENPLTIAPSELNEELTAIFTSLGENGIVIHYFHFNDLHSNSILDKVLSDFSIVGSAAITYPGSGSGYMDNVDDGTSILALDGIIPGRALRVRNPSHTRNLILSLPTVGYDQLSLRYAAKRTNNGAGRQAVFYRTSTNGSWNLITDTLLITPDWQEYNLSLVGIEGVDNNASFEIMIRFLGQEAGNSSGNNRFDNITLVGSPLPDEHEENSILKDIRIFPNPANDQISLSMTAQNPLFLKMYLYDINGRLIQDFQMIGVSQGSNIITQDISSIPNGQYFLSIKTEGQVYTVPFLKI